MVERKSFLEQVASNFGTSISEGTEVLELGGDLKIHVQLWGETSVSISHRQGDRTAQQISPITFDEIISQRIDDDRVLFRRIIKDLDQTLTIFSNGNYIIEPTNPDGWED
ncbi:hypothetical protein A2Z23_02085 [Candidatus Curtissbacteria bacterium RBG_16_39_7]|uniref:Uncharacterized protein n=1 Tax=Candidatus Curtissbacteria bacterium RBG_16_39_7 TaxID=1797707 RepID=A0A1F5G1V8_9BACT|nr:MAG: hypothetical protein A2Z23_02085 [Candidatus Curtissbacteria bacterium RBG_16_39_7]